MTSIERYPNLRVVKKVEVSSQQIFDLFEKINLDNLPKRPANLLKKIKESLKKEI